MRHGAEHSMDKHNSTDTSATAQRAVASGPLVRLDRRYTMIHLTPASRSDAVKAAYWVTCSPCEWTWTPEQQALMARYCLWASQRLEAVQQISAGKPLMHEPSEPCDHKAGFWQFEGETYCRTCGENEERCKPNAGDEARRQNTKSP